MKNIFKILLFVFLGVLVGGIVFRIFLQSESASTEQKINVSPQVDGITNTPSIPTHISIQSIHIDASIEPVGQDAKGNMDVPSRNEDVAWYRLGFKPGEKGSAVLAGHLDTVSGAPAVFYDLSKIKNGDDITITDASSNISTYTVIASDLYDFDKLPLQEIFASSQSAQLRLITCDGAFDKQEKNYSKRRVVTAQLVQ